MKKVLILIVVCAFFVPGAALGEDQFGIQIYPGAKPEPATSKALKDLMGFNASCFRTNDSVAKVADFYKKLGLKLLDISRENAAFQARGTNLTIQNPWVDIKTSKLNEDTLISIVKE